MKSMCVTIWAAAVAVTCLASCGGNVVVDGTPAGAGGMDGGTTTGAGGVTCAAGMMCCTAGCGTCAPMVTGACTELADCGG